MWLMIIFVTDNFMAKYFHDTTLILLEHAKIFLQRNYGSTPSLPSLPSPPPASLPPSPSPPPPQVVCLARMMVYFGFYNFSKLLILTRVLFDGLDAKSANTPGNVGGIFGPFNHGETKFTLQGRTTSDCRYLFRLEISV